MSASDEEIYQLVRQEAEDCLRRMKTNLLALESGQGGAEAVDAILRDAHSIKGSAAMIGWQELAGLANAIEDRMELARETGSIEAAAIDPLLRAVDVLGRAVKGEEALAGPVIEELAGPDPERGGEAGPSLPPSSQNGP